MPFPRRLSSLSLRVRDLEAALAFYRDLVGANIWAGRRKAPPGAAGLLGYTLLDSWGQEMALRDPTGAEVRLSGPRTKAPTPS